jgi:hypothetical protein
MELDFGFTAYIGVTLQQGLLFRHELHAPWLRVGQRHISVGVTLQQYPQSSSKNDSYPFRNLHTIRVFYVLIYVQFLGVLVL